jgi:hypothetical protein
MVDDNGQTLDVLLTLVNEEFVLTGVVHSLPDIPMEEGVCAVTLNREELASKVEAGCRGTVAWGTF